MRTILIFIITFLTLSVFGQINPSNNLETKNSINNQDNKTVQAIDSILSVEYVQTREKDKSPIYYLNGEIVSSSIIKTLDPKVIDSINVEKRTVEINGKEFYGQIFIKTKNGYNPTIISLEDLKSKYLNQSSDKPVIFMIDNEFIKGDYKNFIVDENFIFKIIVDIIENEQLNIQIVKLLTKTEKNIKDSKQIMIRGLEELTLD